MPSADQISNKRAGVLDAIERIGNALPDPVLIFVWLSLVLVAASCFAAAADYSAVHPLTGEVLHAKNLLSSANLRRLFVEMPQTFAAFPPLGLVLVVMFGAAVAERSGFFAASIGRAVRNTPTGLLTPIIFLIGLLSHQASDAAYVVLIPLAALIYQQAGRHPLIGVAVTYAGISGAFAANVLPGQFDVLLLGITQSAARLIEPARQLNPLGNWWFTATLGAVLLFVAWWVTESFVRPRLESVAVDATGETAGAGADMRREIDPASDRRGLIHASIAIVCVLGIFAALTLWPEFAPLVDRSANGAARYAPFYQSLVAGFMLIFLAAGWFYGRAVGTIRTHRDVVAMMVSGLKELTPYFVLAFFAAHFIAMFGWSNLGPIIAINGAEWLRGLGVGTVAMLLPLLLLTMLFDFLIGSASAKWSAMAPVLVPMLMLVGVAPEMTTAAFRVGDSIVNIITPVAANFVLVLVMCQRWNKNFGVGSLIAMMLPYSIAFGLTGIVLVVIWAGFELPLGPGAPAMLLHGAAP